MQLKISLSTGEIYIAINLLITAEYTTYKIIEGDKAIIKIDESS